MIESLVSSFYLKYLYLFSRQGRKVLSFVEGVPITQPLYMLCCISTHALFFNDLGGNCRCCRFFLSLSPHVLLSLLFFSQFTYYFLFLVFGYLLSSIYLHLAFKQKCTIPPFFYLTNDTLFHQ